MRGSVSSVVSRTSFWSLKSMTEQYTGDQTRVKWATSEMTIYNVANPKKINAGNVRLPSWCDTNSPHLTLSLKRDSSGNVLHNWDNDSNRTLSREISSRRLFSKKSGYTHHGGLKIPTNSCLNSRIDYDKSIPSWMGSMGDIVRSNSIMVMMTIACWMRDTDDEGLGVAVALARERKRSRMYEMPKYDGNMFSNANSCNHIRK